MDAAARFESDDNSLQVQSGRYNSASEVVREALRLLEEHEQIRDLQIQELRKKIAEGINQLDRGEGISGKQVFAELDTECDSPEQPQSTE